MNSAKLLGSPKTPLRITVDTREQNPYRFPAAYAETTAAALPVGDYCLTGDDWVIERKSVDDLIASLITNHLEQQLRRMRAAQTDGLIVLVVDGDKDDFAAWPWGERTAKASCAWAFGKLYSLAYELRVCVDWNPSRQVAGMSCWRWLRTREKAK